MHAVLLAFLWIGVRWQNETPIAVEAEVWSPQIREAAPLARPEPKPQAEEKPAPTPKPIPKVEPPTPLVKPVDPDIALEQEKKRKAEQLKERLEEEREQKLKKQADEKRLEKDKQDKVKLEQAKLDKEKTEKAKLDAELKKAELDKKRKTDDLDNKKLAKIRDEEMRRIAGGAAVGTGGSGDAPKSQGPRGDPSYIQKVGAKIKSNTVFNVPEDTEGNPAVEYAVDLLPDGSVRGIRKVKSSGLPGFDEAVSRAIEKSQPFPPDKSGIAPSGFTVSHKPKN
ncbi:colicin import membrane protein [Actimicrobium sp. GrIS 1.19]|uniref:energy transducer TonB n=1 Tax=Actimicrobium sp. GrIS 1.19 TaxID=3071708 RepID=UPI002E04F4AF|nr:colicin import membrane protein [Actimicrobium sp. GrIS 1.19]